MIEGFEALFFHSILTKIQIFQHRTHDLVQFLLQKPNRLPHLHYNLRHIKLLLWRHANLHNDQ
jgi:hypothetical protein